MTRTSLYLAAATIAFATALHAQSIAGRDKQIVDETGLTGTYDITLRLPAAAMQGIGDGGAEEETGSDYISAAEKAGFKFVSRKETLPVVIIDHIDPPTPN